MAFCFFAFTVLKDFNGTLIYIHDDAIVHNFPTLCVLDEIL